MLLNYIKGLETDEECISEDGYIIKPIVTKKVSESTYTMFATIEDVVELPEGITYAIGVRPQDRQGNCYEKLFFLAHKYFQVELLAELMEPSFWYQSELWEFDSDYQIPTEVIKEKLIGYTCIVKIKVKNGNPVIVGFESDQSLKYLGYKVADGEPGHVKINFDTQTQTEPLSY